jgi:hypothetical protein
MKKIDFTLAVMALLLSLLCSTALMERRVIAQDEGFELEQNNNLTCASLAGANCCGSANCGGPGSNNNCTLTCSGGGTITCAKIVNGVCQ